MTSDQKRARVIMQAIRQVLMEDWDPIGLGGTGPKDEYDDYIGPVYHLLAQNASEDEVMNLLFSLESNGMGRAAESKEDLQPVARKLLTIPV